MSDNQPNDEVADQEVVRRMTMLTEAPTITIKAGELTKQSAGLIKNWRKRWFVLTSNLLAYLDRRDGVVKGGILLEHATEVREASPTESGKPASCFIVATPDRDFLISTASADDRAEWISAISDAITAIKAGSPSPGTAANAASVSQTGGGDAKPRLFATPGCPYVLKCLAFLADAGLMDGRVEIVDDSPTQRAWVAEKAGAPGVYPALWTTDEKIIMYPDTDGIVNHLAAHFGVDTSKLFVYNHYIDGVFPRYGAMMANMIKNAGGWPAAFPSVGIQRLLLLGGSGMVGSRLATEARQRGHFVTIASRSAPDQALHAKVDASDRVALEAVLRNGLGFQAVVVALGPSRTKPDAPVLVDVYKSVVAACRAATTRVLFVGGAGSLFAAEEGGMLQMNAPEFPDDAKPEAQAHTDALEWLRTVNDVHWTSLAPAPMMQPGERTGAYKLGNDVIVGFTISAEDYAVAALDEIDTPKHDKARFAVAAAE